MYIKKMTASFFATRVLLYSEDTDNMLGRFSRESMSDQQCMEYMIAQVTQIGVFKTTEGYFKDVCAWQGVTCDSSGAVLKVNWRGSPLLKGGTIELKYMPEKVDLFIVKRQSLHGTLPADSISPNLRGLDLVDNFLGGEIQWKLLPTKLENMLLDENFFSGTVDLTCLPKELRMLGLSSNRLSGSIDITALPRNLVRLYMNENLFNQSTIDVNNIPKAAECYIFTDNNLGKVVVHDNYDTAALFF
mmetsp:Transcript_34556/g.53945  ORF Transcript_34556/g.53945 Transcript_34556/m.53945 type:complete len:245 (-) Transcript_34556:12-746(-)